MFKFCYFHCVDWTGGTAAACTLLVSIVIIIIYYLLEELSADCELLRATASKTEGHGPIIRRRG